MDFLAENNECGQSILRLVSRGNAIIAELLRLSEFIPPVFRLETKTEQTTYGQIVSDFSYFRQAEYFEHNIDSNSALQDKDEEFRENHLEILTRFYLVFESVHKYIVDLNKYVDDLWNGYFIQQTLESVLSDEDGKQLMAEAVYLYGVILLTVDHLIDGVVRERLLVSYHRYSAEKSAADTNIGDVYQLLRSTGFSPHSPAKRPQNYPESYFSRVRIDHKLITMLIGRLRSDDIYNQIRSYPLPEHRSTALSTQAGMLYILLFFAPEILNNEQAIMREIVDKYFPDNFVISTYMGQTANLAEAWAPYKAAYTALNNTLDPANIKNQAARNAGALDKLLPSLHNNLKEGVLEEDFVLDNISKLMDLLRMANVTLRWLIMHTAPLSPLAEMSRRCRLIRDQVLADCRYQPLRIFKLLLDTAQFEFKLKQMFQRLMAEKEAKWEHHKQDCFECMQELSDVFSGTKPLTRVEKNDKLQKWFQNMGNVIKALDYADSTAAGRKIVQLIQAFEEVQEFHQLESNLQVKQFLKDTCGRMYHMIRVISIKEEVLVTLQVVSDLSYARELIEFYSDYMQRGVKEDPSMVIKLRATFLKLASALDLPLLRINQANSKDLESVSEYYSSELVAYFRRVLQIIPRTMFGMLAKIIQIQTERMTEVPTRLDKDKMRDYAQLDERYQVAKLTHNISVFTEGMLQMKTTLVGIIEVDPRRLLEDGIRKELVNRVAQTLHDSLVFNSRLKTSELVPKLESLVAQMAAYRRSFEYIQDYVNIYGLKIWQEEVSRIINYNVEQECNTFLRVKISDWQSIYQSKKIPIPKFAQTDAQSVNFIGRLAREIIRITDPKQTIYVSQMRCWYDAKTKAETVNGRLLFQKIEKSVDTFGLTGLDRLLSFMIVKQLKKHQLLIQNQLMTNKEALSMLDELRKRLGSSSTVSGKAYDGYIHRASRIWQSFLDILMRVGQLQLLRRLITHQLQMMCKFDSKLLASALSNFNSGLLTDIRTCKSSTDDGDDNQLIFELSAYLEWSGLNNPSHKVYVPTQRVPHTALFNFLMIISLLPRFAYSRATGILLGRKSSEPLDGTAYILGLTTLLRQQPHDVTDEFLKLCGQFVRSTVETPSSSNVKCGDVSPDVANLLVLLEELLNYTGINRQKLEIHIPSNILDHYRITAVNSSDK